MAVVQANVGLQLGAGGGHVAQILLDNDFDHNALRPFKEGNRNYISRNRGKNVDGKTWNMEAVPIRNDATLRKDEWIQLDKTVLVAGRTRLRAFADLRSASSYSIGDGMGTTVLQTQAMSDPGSAMISMDGLRQGEGDRPHFDLTNLPLPIIHSDWQFPAREIWISRKEGRGLDYSMAEAAARRVAEKVEELTVGVAATYSFGGGTIYGYLTYPDRITKVITSPEAGGWTPEDLLEEVMEMRAALVAKKKYGPYRIYVAPGWDAYLDTDYSAAKGDLTVRDRLLKVSGITSISTLDTLTGYRMVMVQMDSATARAVVGMELTTVQWETHGGMQFNFKTMCILIPQMRKDYDSNTGIVDANIA